MDSDSEVIEDNTDDCLQVKNILLRNYQSKLLEEAKKGNTILFLPTGSGKTLIAVHVLLSRTKDIRRPYENGGKRAFFVANTKVLVIQLGNVLRTLTKFKVGCFTGDMDVDSWNRQKWVTQFQKFQVLVLTGEILKQILQLNFISPLSISLIVIDECHHAVLDHPYRLIMKTVGEVDPSKAPLILGLSAVLLNSTPKNGQVLPNIQALETTFRGKVITQKLDEEILRFSTNPIEKIIVYSSNNSKCEKFIKELETVINVFNEMDLKPQGYTSIPKKGIDFKNRNKAKRIKSALVICSSHFQELGMFGGFISALFFIILLEKYRLLSDDQNEIQALIYARTELNKIRHVLFKIMGEEVNGESIIKYTSDKVRQLIQIIRNIHESFKEKHFSALVFVQKRATAVVLAYIFKRLSAVDSRFDFVKADFIVGSSLIVKESIFLESNTESVVKRFDAGALNLLISTNLLEEGVDISNCNVVISFDFPQGYPSYFQSKGRARDKSSLYYIFVEKGDLDKKLKLLNGFKAVSDDLNEFQTDKDEENEDPEGEGEQEATEKIVIQQPFGPVSVDGITAIKAVYRYCSKLPQDRYSLLSPESWYINSGAKKKAFVQLPINCPLRTVVEGDEKESKKLAKRSAFLNTLKKLYEMGELDEDFNPKDFQVKEEKLVDLFPHFINENIDERLPQPGTTKRKQTYKERCAESLSKCLPSPGAKCYLHVVDLKVEFDKPELERKVAIYELLKIPATFAIVSSKKLEKILQFPLFIDIGRITCDFLVNYEEIFLSESEINDIKNCHFAIFKKVTRILKNSQAFDTRNKENSFFIAPVEKNEKGRFVLNWDIIRCDFCKNNHSALVKYNPSAIRGVKRNTNCLENPETKDSSGCLIPTDIIRGSGVYDTYEDGDGRRPQFAMTEAEYKYFVLVPNYRKQDPPLYYIVNKFHRDMSPLSPFPRTDYEDYITYYKEKYEIEITNSKQPLLGVTPLYNCSNFNKPRDRKPKRARERFKECDELLIPELCDIVPFDKRFWIKALLIPTVLNRISHVYCVDEFRRKMFFEMGLGSGNLPEGKNWRPLEVDGASEDMEEETAETSFSELKSALPLSQLKDKTQMNKEVVLDPERHLYEFSLCDLEIYMKKLSGVEYETNSENCDELVQKFAPALISTPPIEILRKGKCGPRPDLALLIEAFTSKSANDIVNYERLEILGDSFLKFATTLYLFRTYPGNEGVLTSLKGKIVGNRNLLYCGLAKNIQDVMNVVDFTPLSYWNPPLLKVPEELAEDVVANNADSAVLYRFEIPDEEQFSGVLSEETLKRNKDIIKEHEKSLEMSTNSLLPYRVIGDKTVADCVEALIGTHLSTLGLPGAFECLAWFGVLPKSNGSYEGLIEKPFKMKLFGSGGEDVVMNILSEVFYSELEELLNYQFKNKAILLEALTHPSYSRNRVTDCYQRLEFLGDAVLDFLITCYVYEKCGSLTPGQVTDIRSALVNNITFACLVVRYQMYSYMLSFSTPLNSAIENFVKYQRERNHEIDDNVLILLNENDCMMAETVQVPKALGDIFESLAGAVFLDSGNSLETVWRVFYKLMKHELDEFTKTVPKTCVRLLHEITGDKPYYECKVMGNITKVACSIYYMNEEVRAHGFGPNKKEAKRSAAKLVLNKILEMKKD